MKKFILVIFSVILTVVVFDLVLMPFNLVFNAATLSKLNFEDPSQEEFSKFTKDQLKQWSQSDTILGYLPKMGPRFAYSDLGAQHNNYDLIKPDGVQRILMLGDSIAAIGFLATALEKALSSEKYQIWNGGVFGYSTFQEVEFYQRYLRKIKPDIVLLEFCLNDFDGTPVIIKNKENETIFATMYLGSEYFNTWLFTHSTTYRIWLSIKRSIFKKPGLTQDLKRHILKLNNICKQDNTQLFVIIYPLFLKAGDWPSSYKQQHKDIIQILQNLNIRFYDAEKLLSNELLDNNLSKLQMAKGDIFHPSHKFSAKLAEMMTENGEFSFP